MMNIEEFERQCVEKIRNMSGAEIESILLDTFAPVLDTVFDELNKEYQVQFEALELRNRDFNVKEILNTRNVVLETTNCQDIYDTVENTATELALVA